METMKRKMQPWKRKMENAAIAAKLRLLQKERDFWGYLKNNRGAFQIDGLVKLIAELVVGGLLLAALYWLFKDTVIPQIQSKIMEMFNSPARP